MISNFNTKSRKELLKTPIVQQTSFRSEVKKNMGVESLAFDFRVHYSQLSNEPSAKSINSDILVLLKQIGNNASIGYVP